MCMLTDLEDDVLKILISSSECDQIGAELKAQTENIKDRIREFTEKGFYTTFLIGGLSVLPENRANFELECDLIAADTSLDPLGFILYVRTGLIHLLEGFVYGDRWPSDLAPYSVSEGLARWEFRGGSRSDLRLR